MLEEMKALGKRCETLAKLCALATLVVGAETLALSIIY